MVLVVPSRLTFMALPERYSPVLTSLVKLPLPGLISLTLSLLVTPLRFSSVATVPLAPLM